MKKHVLAFDIGIASVGWAVVDSETLKIEESGVNLFTEGDATENANRRAFRQARRGKRRQHTRIEDFNKLWEKYGFSVPKITNVDVLSLRNQGLVGVLSENDIYSVLKFMLKYRGISYLEDDIDENAKGSYAKGIAINQSELLTKLPCVIQKERLEKYGAYRGNNVVLIDEEEVILRNVFTTSAYKKELSFFLDFQAKENSKISQSFIDEYIKIFSRKREYYEGPGNELSRTDYGRYTTKIGVDGKYITEENIFEKLIGKCSVYPEETRASAASLTAQEYNALNDLNNLIINGRKLEIDEKKQIISHFMNDDTINVRKVIKSVIGEDIETITGFRIDKDDKEQYHTMELYRKMRKAFSGINYDIKNLTKDELDLIANILTLNTEFEGIEKAINKSELNLSSEMITFLVGFRRKNSTMFNKWHSFSLKIMNELIPELYAQPKNQMELLTEMGIFKGNIDKFKGCKKLPSDIVLEEIYNPVVRRSISITIKVLNALIDKYGFFEKIVIEMPRDKNSDEEKRNAQKKGRENEKELKEIFAKVKSDYGINITDETLYKHKGLLLKLKLWNEQGGRCLYSGKTIDINQLINDREMFEVDHIIPISISFDDSRSNKALVYATENQKKGNKTPIMYLSTMNREWGMDEYISYVKTLKFNSKNKIKNLLFGEDITKVDILKGFINRNLNDTRYASKVVLNSLQGYFKANDIRTIVSVIRGSFTHQMRKNLNIHKDRDKDYSHHAVDAMLIAYSKLGYDEYKVRQEQIVDFETGEIMVQKEWDNLDEYFRTITYQKQMYDMRQNIVEAEKKIKYWHKIDRKCNRALCNQTIYGTREYQGEIYTINTINLYDQNGINTFRNLINKGKESCFLMYDNDRKTFDDMMIVFRQYENEANPFIAYHNETGDYIRKYSKKHNGPKITKIKFRAEKTGSCL